MSADKSVVVPKHDRSAGLRILSAGNMYPPHALGGYELTWEAAVARMRRRGHRVRVLTTDFLLPEPVGPDDPEARRELRWYWRNHEFPRLPARERFALERHNARVLRRHLAELRPDALNWWGMGGMSLSLIEQIRRTGIPAVGVVGDEWMVYGRRVDGWLHGIGRRRRLRWPAERLTGIPARLDLSGAGVWLFNSATTRERALGAAGRLADARVLHPGIDQRLFRPAAPRDWGGRLVYVGRIDPRKGIGVAIDALPHVPGAALEVIGGGDDRHLSELRSQANRIGVGERVRFSRRPRAELAQAYAAADAVLFPVQWEEPWGLVPLEAMAVGRPVVASGTGGSAEYLRHEDNCLIYSPRDDPAALAGAIMRLAGEQPLRQRLREAGLRTAARFDADEYGDAIADALEEAAEHP